MLTCKNCDVFVSNLKHCHTYLFYFILFCFYKKRPVSFDGRRILTIQVNYASFSKKKVNYASKLSILYWDGENVSHHLTRLVRFASRGFFPSWRGDGARKLGVLLVPFCLVSLALNVRMCVYIYII